MPIASCASWLVRHLFPWACSGCGTPIPTLKEPGFCSDCCARLPWIHGVICERCGIGLPEGGMYCFACRTSVSSLRIRSAVSYQGPIRAAIHRFKYGGRESLSTYFADWLAKTFQTHYPHYSGLVVPVPLHPRSLRKRGYNQAAILAEELAERLHLPYMGEILERRRHTKPQSQLNREQRMENVSSAFRFNGRELPKVFQGRAFLLIDDVCTTGSTLRECARVLKRGGAKDVRALALARDGC